MLNRSKYSNNGLMSFSFVLAPATAIRDDKPHIIVTFIIMMAVCAHIHVDLSCSKSKANIGTHPISYAICPKSLSLLHTIARNVELQ